MKKLLIAVMSVLFVFGGIAYADVAPNARVKTFCTSGKYTPGGKTDCTSYNLLDAVDCTTDTATLTVTKRVEGYSKLLHNAIIVDANGSIANLQVTCSCSIDNGTTYGLETSREISSGTSTVSQFIDNYAVSASSTIKLVNDVWGCHYYKCVYDDSSGCASGSDTISVQWTLTTGK